MSRCPATDVRPATSERTPSSAPVRSSPLPRPTASSDTRVAGYSEVPSSSSSQAVKTLSQHVNEGVRRGWLILVVSSATAACSRFCSASMCRHVPGAKDCKRHRAHDGLTIGSASGAASPVTRVIKARSRGRLAVPTLLWIWTRTPHLPDVCPAHAGRCGAYNALRFLCAAPLLPPARWKGRGRFQCGGCWPT